MKIAIIGISGLYPGSSTPQQFWDNLISAKDLTSLAKEEDFGVEPKWFFHPERGKVDRCYSLKGGYVRDFVFDPSGYELPADFLNKQDKLYQWTLHVAREALRESGYLHNQEVKSNCGLILGNLSFPTGSSHKLLSSIYAKTVESGIRKLLDNPDISLVPHWFQTPESDVLTYTPSQMVAESLGLKKGHHFSLDAACASSLYAIKLACDELKTERADLMLAGAVCAADQLFIHMGFSIFHAYADEKYGPLDKTSSGLVSAEGAGMVVLKRWEDAKNDGDHILGVIRGIGLSNDGRGKFLLSPHSKGQIRALERAYDHPDIEPQDTRFIECHATGTPLGDSTEINSIADFFVTYDTKPLLGAVKSNMGHLLTAAGMSGIQKVLLAMQHQVIPVNINLNHPIQSDNGWIGESQMVTTAQKWNSQKKQAGINAFGFGGTNAHLVIQNQVLKNDLKAGQDRTTLVPMAIIGMDVHFGDISNLDEFYGSIYHGKQHFRKLPEKRWKGFDQDTGLLKSYGLTDGLPPTGAYIEDFELDLLRYKIQPRELETLEPQQALILKVADQAIKDSGLVEGQDVGVVVAMESELAIHHYLARWDIEWQLRESLEKIGYDLSSVGEELIALCRNVLYQRKGDQTPSQHTSFVGNIMASRIASLWDFSGPAFTVSAGEDSVYKALQVAQNMLSQGEVEAVVVGAVDFSGGMENVFLRNKDNPVHSSDNPGLSLDINQDGWLVGEGAGAIVVKNNRTTNQGEVYAVIESLGSYNIPEEGGYLELAATGVQSQDEKENRFLTDHNPMGKVALGSVKANIGHTFAASGMASLIKSALCLAHKFIPCIPQWNQPKEIEAFRNRNYYFPTYSHPWILSGDQKKRRAFVNGQENIQIKLAEAKKSKTSAGTGHFNQDLHLFILSGNSEEELTEKLFEIEKTVRDGIALAKIANECYERYLHAKGTYCIALVTKDSITDLLREISFFKHKLDQSFRESQVIKTPSGSYFTNHPLGKKGKIAFVYPGSSTSYPGLGKDLFQLFPSVFDHFEKLIPNLDDYVCPEYLFPRQISRSDAPTDINENPIAMMSAGVFYSTCLTYMVKSLFKIDPDIAFGYSMGECSSMWYALGVWNVDEAKEFQQSPIFKKRLAGNMEALVEHWEMSAEDVKSHWVSMVLLASKDEVANIIEQENQAFLTFINTEREVIISGDRDACNRIVEKLECPYIHLPFQNLIHHEFCKNEWEGLLKMHQFPIQNISGIDFFSSISKSVIKLDSRIIAENSTKVCCHQVDFPATVNAVYKEGAVIFIELGANSTCTNWIDSILNDKDHLAVSFNQKGKSDLQSIIEASAKLISHGVSLDLSSFYTLPKEQAQQSQFVQKVTPGGERIFSTLLSPQHKERFGSLTPQVLTKTKTSHEDAGDVVTQPAVPASSIGENGLRLQNFNDGEHLVGKEIIFSQEDLEEFAAGKIANVFGPEYSEIDSYQRRVRLPMHPYLLVSRVTGIEAKMNVFEPSFIQTEYDIPYQSWFCTDGQIPWAVSVESGQCDLLLISYLGIDFQNKGDLVYRLLDCTLTFVDDLPYEGQTLRYDISINSFVQSADNLLFFFSYRCYVQDRLVLMMDDGCAGFFNDNQLGEGRGVVYTEREMEARKKIHKKHFIPLLRTPKTSFSKRDLEYLIEGKMEKCFDHMSYFANGRNHSLCLPPEKILMIDRIVSVDLTGGVYGLGYIIAEKDLHPDDWYFPCHFLDDQVLAGSLQAEGGGNLLRFFMLMIGLQKLTKDARYQPVFDLPQKVRCRKEVTPKDSKLVYRLEIKEIGLIPYPYVIGDLEILSNGIITVHFENLGLQLREKSNPRYLEKENRITIPNRTKEALFNEKDITVFALDDLSKCFGPDFKVFDGRPVSRQPNTDLQFISRVLRIDGKRGDLDQSSTVYAEYDVPSDAWYLEQNSNPSLPYSILMEIALQPCGLLGEYLGSTLLFPDKDLRFRNLDGEGMLLDHALIDLRGKTVHNKSTLVSSVVMGGTVLQNYTFELSVDGVVFYSGKSSFGFFPHEVLASQVGLDKGAFLDPWYISERLSTQEYMQINLDSLYGRMKLFKAPDDKPFYRLAEDQLHLIDKVLLAKDQGRYNNGYIHATKFINPYEWFFTCHFYQDPVMPGSLGVEAILQAMQVYALQQDLGKDFHSPRFVSLANHRVIWKYRGQILMDSKVMYVEVHIKTIEKRNNQLVMIGDAHLWNDTMRIYHITDLALAIEEA